MRRAAVLTANLLVFAVAPAGLAQEAPGWSEVGALFAERCTMCHAGAGAPLGLGLDSYEAALAGSQRGPVLVPHDPEESELVRRIRGEVQPRMPLVGEP